MVRFLGIGCCHGRFLRYPDLPSPRKIQLLKCIQPGGQDSQIIIPNGAARLETNYLLQTLDNPPAPIVVKTHGWRTGPPEILAQLADPKLADNVDPNNYKFRIFIEMETGDERYRDILNCGMWVGSGMRKGSEVIYE